MLEREKERKWTLTIVLQAFLHRPLHDTAVTGNRNETLFAVVSTIDPLQAPHWVCVLAFRLAGGEKREELVFFFFSSPTMLLCS
jgi:hypothetical protein